MLKEVLLAFREAAYFVGLALKGLCFWRKPPPVTTPAELRGFIESRAKAVTQVTLFGYLKTRAGTRYTSLFEDDVFANSISIAILEIYLAALSDLTVFAAARVGRDAGASAEEIRSLALCLHNNILTDEEIPEYRPQGFDAARSAFSERVADVPWPDMAQGEAAFRGSLAALVEWAPVAPELKSRDTEIVETSMRFRWKAVRDQFAEILDASAVMAAWRAEPPQAAAGGEIAAPAN
jgi:hypothetical protein